MEKESGTRRYDRKATVIFCLQAFPLPGLYGLWRSKQYTKKQKRLVWRRS